MPVNLLVDFADGRFSEDAVPSAVRAAAEAGYRLVHARRADDRLAAWIDWQFPASWWSSEARAGQVWYAVGRDGDIAGFAAFDVRGLRFPWLARYRERTDVGIFGPYGITPAHRGTGVGDALLTAALASLRDAGYSQALIPAVSADRLVTTYRERTGARVADEFAYDPPRRYRAVILASGGGTNAQNVIDAVAQGRIGLDLCALVANTRDAFALQRARRAGIAHLAVTWDRAREARAAYDARVIAAVAAHEPELILLLGWMHLLPPAFIERFSDILNVHPAFLPFDADAESVVMPDGSSLPAFRGAHAVRDALAARIPWSGASVHRVTNRTDRGAIVVRTPFQVDGGADEAAFVRVLRPVEHAAVLAAIRRWTFER